MIRHPSRKRLTTWADGELEHLTAHIEHCDRCNATLDELTRLDPSLKRGLARVTQPRPGFADRLDVAVRERRRNTEAWSVIGDLFSLGWRTFDALAQQEDSDDD